MDKFKLNALNVRNAQESSFEQMVKPKYTLI